MGAFIMPILAGLSGLAGAFGSKKQVSDTTSNSTTTPNYDPATLAFKNQLMNLFTNNLNNLPTQSQFQTAGLKNIQEQSGNAQSGLEDILAAHGLSRTTAGGTSAFDTSYKEGQGVSNFLTNAPFNYQSAIQPTLSNASGFLSSLPIGTTTNGTSHTVGTGGATSPLAGGIVSGASTLAGFLGQQQAQNSLGNILKTLGQSNGSGTPTMGTNGNSGGAGGPT